MTTRDQQQPPDLNLNAPEGGSYGEQAAIDNLEGQLPEVDPVSEAPLAGPGGGGPGGAPPLGEVVNDEGYPPELFQAGPTPGLEQPGGAPTPGMGGIVDHTQARLATLDALANSPEVSEATREWAAMLVEELAGA